MMKYYVRSIEMFAASHSSYSVDSAVISTRWIRSIDRHLSDVLIVLVVLESGSFRVLIESDWLINSCRIWSRFISFEWCTMKCAFYIKALEKSTSMASFIMSQYSWAVYYLSLVILYILRREPAKNQFFIFLIV